MKGNSALIDFATLTKELAFREIEVLENKHQIFFDLESKRKSRRSMVGCFPLICAPGFFAAAAQIADDPDIGWLVARVLGAMGLIFLVIGLLLLYGAKGIDDRYLLDFEREELIEFKKKGKEVIRRTICTFGNLEVLVLYSNYSFRSGSEGWQFGLSLITEAGSLLELISRRKNAQRREVVRIGVALSSLLGLNFDQGEEGTIFNYKESPKGLEYEFVPFGPKDSDAVNPQNGV